MTDMTDKAVAWIKYQKALTPQKPSFIYFAPGATHAPHHVPKEWIARWKGKFDQGWDKMREETLARQIKLGVVPPGTKLAPKPAAIRDWDNLSADEKRLFARQAEVFAAFVEYTDHEIGRMLKAFEDVGQADNTLVVYIAGDNGTSGEGGANGMFNEYTYFNGVQETVEDAAEDRPVGRPGDLSAHGVRLGSRIQLAVRLDEAGALRLRRHAQRHGRVLAQGHQGEERDPHPVRSRDRRRADHPAGDRLAGTESGQRHAADPDGGHEPRVHVRRRERRRSGIRRSTSRSPATARSTTTAGSPARSTKRRGKPSRGERSRTTPAWQLYDTRTDFSLANDLAAKNPRSCRTQAYSCRKPRSITCCRWTTASSSGWTVPRSAVPTSWRGATR
jgi:hypothetical protein